MVYDGFHVGTCFAWRGRIWLGGVDVNVGKRDAPGELIGGHYWYHGGRQTLTWTDTVAVDTDGNLTTPYPEDD